MKESSFCGFDPRLTLALPTDLQIVCGEHNIDVLPEAVSAEIEVVLDILRFNNHYKYDPSKGPFTMLMTLYSLTGSNLVLIILLGFQGRIPPHMRAPEPFFQPGSKAKVFQ